MEIGVQEPGSQLGNQRTVIVKKVSEGAQVSQAIVKVTSEAMHSSCKTLIEVHEMHGRMHPN